MKYLMTLLLTVAVAYSCGDTEKSKTPVASEAAADVHKVVAQEVLQVNEYTYVRVSEDGNEYWVAAPTTPVAVGNTYYYGKAMEMNNFESKELGKTFETIYFIENIRTTEAVNATTPASGTNQMVDNTKPVIEKADVTIEAKSGTITIAELFQNKAKYNNTVVQLQGKVTKFNPAILNTNWVHIQDGSDFEGNFDITATTNDVVELDEIVTITGKVILDKDFGAGYLYAVLIENATVTK